MHVVPRGARQSRLLLLHLRVAGGSARAGAAAGTDGADRWQHRPGRRTRRRPCRARPSRPGDRERPRAAGHVGRPAATPAARPAATGRSWRASWPPAGAARRRPSPPSARSLSGRSFPRPGRSAERRARPLGRWRKRSSTASTRARGSSTSAPPWPGRRSATERSWVRRSSTAVRRGVLVVAAAGNQGALGGIGPDPPPVGRPGRRLWAVGPPLDAVEPGPVGRDAGARRRRGRACSA